MLNEMGFRTFHHTLAIFLKLCLPHDAPDAHLLVALAVEPTIPTGWPRFDPPPPRLPPPSDLKTRSLGGAVLINPWDTAELSKQMMWAISMEADEREIR